MQISIYANTQPEGWLCVECRIAADFHNIGPSNERRTVVAVDSPERVGLEKTITM